MIFQQARSVDQYSSAINANSVYGKFKCQVVGISRWQTNGTPGNLSITSSEELIVDVRHQGRKNLDIFSCFDVNRTQSISLPTEINTVWHAVQLSNKNIIISHSTENFPDVYQISELSTDGRNSIRTFEPRSIQSKINKNWKPTHLSFDDDDHLFVAGGCHNKVYFLSSQLKNPNILLTQYQHQLDGPHRLCYVREKQQLIVGHVGSGAKPGRVSVFNVCPQQHPVDIEHEQEPNDEQ